MGADSRPQKTGPPKLVASEIGPGLPPIATPPDPTPTAPGIRILAAPVGARDPTSRKFWKSGEMGELATSATWWAHESFGGIGELAASGDPRPRNGFPMWGFRATAGWI